MSSEVWKSKKLIENLTEILYNKQIRFTKEGSACPDVV